MKRPILYGSGPQATGDGPAEGLQSHGRVPEDRIEPVAKADERVTTRLQDALDLAEHDGVVLDVADHAETHDDIE